MGAVAAFAIGLEFPTPHRLPANAGTALSLWPSFLKVCSLSSEAESGRFGSRVAGQPTNEIR